MQSETRTRLGKVPELTLLFWVIKVAATTLGETAGDAVTMSMNLRYLVGTAIFMTVFMVAVAAQIRARQFHAPLFWFVIVATTTAGTTMADFFDRSLGIGYAGGATVLALLLLGSLVWWHRALGSVSITRIDSRKAEVFYWTTIMLSQTLGTALGDWFADPEAGLGLGYQGSALVFGAALAAIAAAFFWTTVSRTALFWAAFILSRPLGATVGDFLDKPLSRGGLALSRYSASACLALFIVACIVFVRQRPERIEVR